jgi:hypothetical protein
VCQVGVPEREHMVQYEELNVLGEVVRDKIEEVLEGLGMK